MKKLVAILFILLSGVSKATFSQINWTALDAHPEVFAENTGQFQNPNGQKVLFGGHLGSTKVLFDQKGYSVIYEAVYDAEEEHERREKLEKGLPLKPRDKRIWRVEFLNANPSVSISGQDRQSFTFTYALGPGKGSHKVTTFNKVVYEDIYPNIDIVFSLSNDNSLKYDIVLKPGSDPESIQIKVPNATQIRQPSHDALSLSSEYFELRESIPSTYFQDDLQPLNCHYRVTGNIIGFELTDHDPWRTVVIDPLLVLDSPFTSGNDYYKLQYDDYGNVWVLGEVGSEIAKFNSDGELQWVFLDISDYSLSPAHGDFVVRPSNGECYVTPWILPNIIRISTDGDELGNWVPTEITFYHEIWTLAYDEINDLLIAGRGAGIGLPPVISQLSPDLSTETATPLALDPYMLLKDPVFMELSPDGTTCYTLIARDIDLDTTIEWLGESYDNKMLKIPVSDFSGVTTFPTHHDFEEVDNSLYSLYNTYGTFPKANNFNGLAVDEDFLYTYDGEFIKKFDRVTETMVDSISTGMSMFTHAGIDIDPCGDLYIGGINEVQQYTSDLDYVTSYAMPDTVIDVRIGNGQVYACGIGFIQSINLPGDGLPSTVDIVPETCDGSSDGSVALSTTSGIAPYTYSLEDSTNTTGFFGDLAPGEYNVVIVDSKGCLFDSTITIEPGLILMVEENFEDASCEGHENGSINLSALNGSAPYTFDIGTSFNTTGDFSDLPTGIYDITVTDSLGCTYNSSITIGAGAGLTLNLVNMNPPSCYGFTDGSITVEVIDSFGSYTYVWSPLNSVPGPTFNNIGAGSYTVTAIDSVGCEGELTIEVNQPDSISIYLDLTHVLCHGDATGEATIDTVDNHQGPFSLISYDWSSGPPGGLGASSATGLTAGQYTLDLTDSAGCAQSIEFIIEEPPILELSEIGFEPAYCRLYDYQIGNGQVYGAAIGGTPDYTYQWENLETGATSTNTTWGGLNPGDYEITVTDENGCVLTQTVSLDSVNPIAVLDIFSDDFIAPLEGTAELCITASNHSEYFANPLNPLGDTTFWFSFNYPQEPYSLYQDDDFFEIFDTCFAEGGQYNVCLKIQNKNGCEDEACYTIIVHTPLLITAPNVFTPDGDGINDLFTFEYKSEGITDFECIIVNRWGNTIHQMFGLTDGWSGQDENGNPHPDGVYFYTYQGTSESGESFSGQGTIQLINGI